jgi:hypothetical protein
MFSVLPGPQWSSESCRQQALTLHGDRLHARSRTLRSCSRRASGWPPVVHLMFLRTERTSRVKTHLPPDIHPIFHSQVIPNGQYLRRSLHCLTRHPDRPLLTKILLEWSHCFSSQKGRLESLSSLFIWMPPSLRQAKCAWIAYCSWDGNHSRQFRMAQSCGDVDVSVRVR